ncbi:polysaccharide deacetylase family protein [Streptomyces sp. NBC_00234]|uniref:polysaccharide deacetylase family protein n=1 Tax=Streptomyces sp. NBC_00234 TaxID=2903638 RepID=UPI002E2E7944|nr:polysaccharide deacetylase family protein [Streptomyces sp. NBC_00234]
MSVVPVFAYHSVAREPASWIAPFSVTPRTFAEQLDRIADAGVSVVPLRQLVAALRGCKPLPEQSAVLTFDDGFADFYWTVAPMLAERGLPATLYVTTGAVHAPGAGPEGSLLPPADMLNWRQIATLDALDIEIGGHSRTHAQLDILPAARARHEVADSKRRLEDVVSHPVSSFAYPQGYHSAAVRRAVREAGWSSGAAAGGAFSSTTDDPWRISRLTVRADTGPTEFDRWVHGVGAPVAAPRESLGVKGRRLYRKARFMTGHYP